uniref:Uncharacterized protein n=1 Tax=Rhizophora mucronata TaxID=61149 RepID=A0A2P2L8P9_RHIMU
MCYSFCDGIFVFHPIYIYIMTHAFSLLLTS